MPETRGRLNRRTTASVAPVVELNTEPAAEYFEQGHTELTKRELKEVAELRGLPTSGTKAELVARLEE